MQLPPDVKKQLEEQKKQCVFCKIISKEIESNIVFEDKETLAFLDIFPLRKGHLIYIPKEHVPLPFYLLEEKQAHYLGLFPQIVAAVQKSMVTTAFSLYQANGGAAGQNVPHTSWHLLPRDRDDGFFQFFWKQKAKNDLALLQQKFAAVFPGMKPKPEEKGLFLYETPDLQVFAPSPALVPGHLEIISKEKELGKLSAEAAIRFFSLASTVAGVVFQSFQAQGTNLIIKSGVTDDHPEGKLTLHIIPRKEDDGLQLWQQKQEQPSYDLKGVASRIKEGMWKVKYVALEKGQGKEMVKEENRRPEQMGQKAIAEKPLLRSPVEEEIRRAVREAINAPHQRLR